VGGIIGLVYAQRLLRNGFPAQLITFGQPKVLRRDHVDRFKQLPCVRVLDVKDPIPHHFAGFCHVGTEVVFLNATDVAITDVPGAWRRRRREGTDGASAAPSAGGAGNGANIKGGASGANAKGGVGSANAKGGGAGVNAKGGVAGANTKGGVVGANAKGGDKDKDREREREREKGVEVERGEGAIEKSVVFNDIDHYLRLIRQKNRMTGDFRRSHIFTAKNSIL
jgi:hypothetical protein